ncbi:hypothetical protein M3697_16960 [Janibacter melonis]|uniref:hypothetical protein n=1 Tax=Janibacter melonis TaxID=262209 RepID=UPI00204430AB|nr:hypothetical protein [Janibacter melonis]MCM3556777.1 hypothetical protein [Janibacter melonis]
MTIYDVTPVDAALILDGLADVLGMLPDLDSVEQEERRDVAQASRAAAQIVDKLGTSSSGTLDSARQYGDTEWRNAILRALLGLDGAEQAIVRSR